MPIVNGQRVLANSPEALSTKNTRGGVNKTGLNTPPPVVTATQPTTTDITAGIPGSLATDQTPGVELPTVTQPIDTANEAKTAGQAYLDSSQAEAQARLDQAQAPITAGEQNIRSLMGLANTESATRTRLEESGGVNQLEENMRRLEQSIAQQVAAIDDFDDMTAFNTEEMRIEGSKRDVTKATFGAQSAEYNLQRALQRRGQAAQLRATVAANAALQGNLELATEQVDKALASIYDPIKQDLAMETFFLQRNDKRFDAAQKEVSDLRMKEIERTFADIDRATNLVDTAVASGYASAEDIKTLTSLSGDPQAQIEMSQLIIADAARKELAKATALKEGQNTVTPSGIQVQVPTFDEWIATKENEALMSFSPAERERMRAQYDSEVDVMSQANRVAKLSPLAAEIVKNPRAFFDLTPTAKGEILTEMANAGIDTAQIQQGKKRPLTATQADDFVQAQIARKGVLELKSKLDQLEATGPIVGGVRQLNPYDPQVVAIMAELTRIVPGLARGIYKEVGVLTDADVDRYIKTLANPALTAEQREQVHNDTMAKVDQSLSIAADTYGALGYDLGTFDVNKIVSGGQSEMTDDQAYAEYLQIIASPTQ